MALDEEDDTDRYRAPALDKGLDILELLAGVDGGLTQAEIAKRLGRSPNEFYRMLDRLVRRGYVTQDRRRSLFADAETVRPCAVACAGAAAGLLRDAADARAGGDARARPTSWLFSIADRPSSSPSRRRRAIGASRSASAPTSACSTPAPAMCCWPSGRRDERAMMIAEHLGSAERPAQPAEFFERLDQIRDRGYEMMASLQTAGVYNLSAPVLGPDGKAIAALTVPYITLVNCRRRSGHHAHDRAHPGDRGDALASRRIGRRGRPT